MGKIVKYCNACEEGFAEKFGFCPNCGSQLTAFELNPLAAEAKPDAEPIQAAEQIPEPSIIATLPTDPVMEAVTEPIAESAPAIAADEPILAETADSFEFVQEVFEDEAVADGVREPEALPATAFSIPVASQTVYSATHPARPKSATYDGFHVTLVEEKNAKQRNLLLLGAFMLIFFGFGFAFIYSLFNKLLDVSAIDTQDLLVYVSDDVPAPFEEELLNKDKEEGGGGGGGGKDEQTPASKGREAAQNENPMFAPSSRTDAVTNPAIPIEMATKNKNPRDAEKTDQPYGLRNGSDQLSDGMGTGGGIGGGNGRGQGNGNGEGLGNGNGSGRGDGDGDGEGNGRGPGGKKDGLDDIVAKVGPTVGVKIVSKPRPGYTDAARVNNIQGTVILKVTFLANGSIGGVSVVKGLPNGLTEQAIAAAKGIRFEPAQRAGRPYAVNKNVEYSFTIF
jgi:TonB family protein